jgi:hypothetical protein
MTQANSGHGRCPGAIGKFVSASATLAAPAASNPAGDSVRGGGRIFINFVRYDPAGSDSGSNAHVNKDIIKITNGTHQRRNLAGWKLRDRNKHTYRFPRTSVGRG